MTRYPLGFCGLPGEKSDYEGAAIVILPVPFDRTSTWLKGADKGPDAIIEASKYLEFYDIETDSEVWKKGIYTAKPVEAASSSALLRKTGSEVSKYLEDGKLVVTIGGEHSVSIGPIISYARRYKDLGILHLDAHADSRDSYEGSRYNHACVVARVREHVKNVISVGIRSMDVSEKPNVDREKMLFAHEIHDSEGWEKKVLREISDTVYITIDLDVFDPGVVPSTGTPEPGGLGWYQVLKLLRTVASSKNVVGFDVVELCPSDAKASDFLAAKLVYTLLSYIYASRYHARRHHKSGR